MNVSRSAERCDGYWLRNGVKLDYLTKRWKFIWHGVDWHGVDWRRQAVDFEFLAWMSAASNGIVFFWWNRFGFTFELVHHFLILMR